MRNLGSTKKEHHLLVIAFSDAGTQPDAVVVKPRDTVVANVAVRSPGRSEYEACFTELEFNDHRRIYKGELAVKDSVIFVNLLILFADLSALGRPCSSWDDTGVGCCRPEQEDVRHDQQVPQDAKGRSPSGGTCPIKLFESR